MPSSGFYTAWLPNSHVGFRGSLSVRAASYARMTFSRYPTVSLGAEFLVMGHLLRRNILTSKAPPNNEGYDLTCIHPDPRRSGEQVRVQVKSRLATDSDRGFPMRRKSVFGIRLLGPGISECRVLPPQGRPGPSRSRQEGSRVLHFPQPILRRHLDSSSSWEKVRTRGINIVKFQNEQGFEQIARDLGVAYPVKVLARSHG